MGPMTNKQTALYIKDDAIGDFLFGTAMIRELKQKYSDVYLICAENVLSIAELYLPNEQIFAVDLKKFKINPFYRQKLKRQWRHLQPSLVVASSLRSSFADRVTQFFKSNAQKGEVVVAVSTDEPAPKKKRRSKIYQKLASYPPDSEHDTRFLCGAHTTEHLLLEAVIGGSLPPERSRPYLPVEVLIQCSANWPVAKENYFCVLPSTGDSRRTYSRQNIVKLAKQIACEANMKAVFLSADPLPELSLLTNHTDQLTNALTNDFAVDLTTKTSIVESLALVAQAKFTLTNETGLGHASWIMGRPTVMIMPGGNFHYFHANDPNLHAVYDYRECFDCHHRCRYKFDERFPCIEEIPLKKIEQTLKDILKKLPSTAL